MEANLLTVLAILVAGYTLLAEEKRIDLWLRFSKRDGIVLAVLVLTLMYVIYLPVLRMMGLSLPIPWLWGFNEELTAFTAMLGILVYVVVKLSTKHLPWTHIPFWHKTAVTLLRSRKFNELAFLLERYHRQLITGAKERWYDKLRAWLLNRYSEPIANEFAELLADFTEEPKVKTRKEKSEFVRRSERLVRRLCEYLPNTHTYNDEGANSIASVLKSRQFVKHLTFTHPLVCARLTDYRFDGFSEFTNAFFVELIANSSSQLSRELADNQYWDYASAPTIDESSPLLTFYLSDIEVASRMGLYKPVGEYIKQYITNHRDSASLYNQPYHYAFDDEERWQSPIFVGIQFFKLMVAQAIHSNHHNHMWPLYLERFAGNILDSYAPSPDVNLQLEFPTRFDYLFYESLSVCIGWVSSVEQSDKPVPRTSEQARSYPEYFAAQALGGILKHIVVTTKLTEDQRIYYVGMIVKKLNDLDRAGKQFYTETVIRFGLRNTITGDPTEDNVRTLYSLYRQCDHTLWERQSTLNNTFKEVMTELPQD